VGRADRVAPAAGSRHVEKAIRHRRISIGAAALAGVLALAGGEAGATVAASPAAGQAGCLPSGAHVIMRSARIVVSRRRDHVLQSCYLESRTVRVLERGVPAGAHLDTVSSTALAVTDRYLAYEAYHSVDAGATMQLRVLDARRDRLVVRAQPYAGAHTVALDAAASISRRDVVLATDGSIAWLSPRPGSDPTLELRVARPHHGSTLVASDADIAHGSAAMNHRFVYWTQAGIAHAAPIG
jgi:hypothetical protein